LWQRVIVAGDLGDDCCYLWFESKHGIVDKESAYPPEIYGAEEVFQIEIEYKAPLLVHLSVGNDGTTLMEAVRSKPEAGIVFFAIMHTFIEQFRQAALW
jgi:hypothetical protein